MKHSLYFLSLLALFLSSCKSEVQGITRIEAQHINVDNSFSENDSIEAFIAPYRDRIAREMDSVLAYAPRNLSKTEGDLNTAIGNLMADAVMEMASPVLESRTGNSIDIVLLNHGGIRSSLSKGEVTTRTAYQVMPFENEVVVAVLSGDQLQKLIDYLAEGQIAHPIAGMQLVLNQDGSVEKALVQGAPIEAEARYYVATSDYLFQGGDNMDFFSGAEDIITLDYKIRNLLIDHFRQQDTISPIIDQRFIRK